MILSMSMGRRRERFPGIGSFSDMGKIIYHENEDAQRSFQFCQVRMLHLPGILYKVQEKRRSA
jgi:hypothetical protein